ncbi:MAG: DUF5752 family protein [Candidatus Woesearchaeota archaeon]
MKLLNLLNRLRPGYRKEVNSAYAILSKTKDPFHAITGHSVDNLIDLFTLLQQMDENSFTHHVNDHKNDFSEWIQHCISDHELSTRLKEMKDKDDVTVAVGLRVKDLLTRIKNG